MKTTVGRMLRKREASDGRMTPFQAVCTALAATVGTGNIAGVAGAIAIGGPGAVFWMWISALLGMCTKFSEVTLAVHFRETNENGELVGGPMYYIKNGLKKHWHWLAYLFSAFGVLTVFGTGNATQVNTITAAIDSALINYNLISSDSISTANLIMGIIIASLVALVLLGGIKRIGQVAEKLVPFMAVFYIILALGVVFLNFSRIPYVFSSIFKGAFTPASVTGGAVGSFFMSMKKGVSRGIFSNEAGLGTGSIDQWNSRTSIQSKRTFAIRSQWKFFVKKKIFACFEQRGSPKFSSNFCKSTVTGVCECSIKIFCTMYFAIIALNSMIFFCDTTLAVK